MTGVQTCALPIYLRETAHNAYRRISYVLANAVVSFPPLVVLSLAFAVTTFFAVGLAGGGTSFMFFALIILASLWAGSGFVTFLSAVVPHVTPAPADIRRGGLSLGHSSGPTIRVKEPGSACIRVSLTKGLVLSVGDGHQLIYSVLLPRASVAG